ncbi:MAG: IPT/TIG domain-containing protein [Candidatus Acidiferrales bacterium]
MRRLPILLLLILICVHFGCGGTSATNSNPNPNPPPGNIIVSVSPISTNVRAGDTQPFTATVSGSSNQSVNWFVNGVAGGSAAAGMITSAGIYTSPGNLPGTNTVTIKAVSAADSSASDTSTVTLLNPIPILSTVNPTTMGTGPFTLTMNGSKFVSGAQVTFGGTALSTTFVSSSKLTATGTAQSAGTFGATVTNPNPGSSTSGSVSVQVTGGGGTPSACSEISLGQGASLNGFLPFPADNAWNTNIANATVDPNSTAIINFIGATVPVHADFGAGQYQGSTIGIPYLVVGAQQNFVVVNFTAYSDESDPPPMPIPATAPIEGYPNPGNGDRHVLVLDNNNCWLYELGTAVPQSDGSWNANVAVVWDLQADEQRPLTWTSADAAGLPIFPGLARYDEVAAGAINHALRFTLQSSRAAFVSPASHWAANSTNALAAPMGMRLRLKKTFDISAYSAANQVILKALQQYGMIMADNGSSMYISGAPDDRWDNNDLHLLGNLTASDFEVVQMNPIYTQSNLPKGTVPSINSFTADSLVISSGTQVTLSWNATGASYFVVSPQVGAVRGTSVKVSPAQTTTYTIAATNQFGRSTATVTIAVQ